ncbi:MAG TPA: hydantoinase/carbamoylase family amidase [archaeon]|nr:hydantoinase/carbamoylase family amidase [archaeon]
MGKQGTYLNGLLKKRSHTRSLKPLHAPPFPHPELLKKEKINSGRLAKIIGSIRRIDAVNPHTRITRLAFSNNEDRALGIVKNAMQKNGLSAWYDSFGNLHGQYGSGAQKPVMISSHLDTVHKGGAFDGLAGVAVGLEALLSIKDSGIRTKRPIKLVIFRGEESVSFGKPSLGSNAAIGELTAKDLARKHAFLEGNRTLRSLLSSRGLKYYPDQKIITPHNTQSNLELHVEQGGKLARSRTSRIAVVDRIAGSNRFSLEFTGEATHSGATEMGVKNRRDALLAASKAALLADELARQESKRLGTDIKATVTDLKVVDANLTAVPGKVLARVDVRGVNERQREAFVRKLLRRIKEQSGENRVDIKFNQISKSSPGRLHSTVKSAIRRAAQKTGFAQELRTLDSGAGHDAIVLSTVIPSGMIFIPSEGGLSHNSREKTYFSDLQKGTILAKHTLIELANK